MTSTFPTVVGLMTISLTGRATGQRPSFSVEPVKARDLSRGGFTCDDSVTLELSIASRTYPVRAGHSCAPLTHAVKIGLPTLEWPP